MEELQLFQSHHAKRTAEKQRNIYNRLPVYYLHHEDVLIGPGTKPNSS